MPKAVKKPKKLPRAKFDYGLDFKNLNLRTAPHLYRIGLGEQGVLSVEPYKSELLPLWRFKTPAVAEISSKELADAFYRYKADDDFVGMDMARKFIQMGVTRARRYANWPGGKKYTGQLDATGKKETVTKGAEDAVKAESARIFGKVLAQVQQDARYLEMAEQHRTLYEQGKSREIMTGKEKETLGKLAKVKKEQAAEQEQVPRRRTRSQVQPVAVKSEAD